MSPIKIRYKTYEIQEFDIHVKTLKNTQQFEDVDNIAEKLGVSTASWSLFGVVWPSGIVLADIMAHYDIKNKIILEVGCGIGLASLVLNSRLANISTTDYNPEAGKYLRSNTKLNDDKNIPFIQCSWESTKETTLGQFDLIIGSDLLYEPGHMESLSSFIQKHTTQTCEVIIIDPKRGNANSFSKLMHENGFKLVKTKIENQTHDGKLYKGDMLKFTRVA